MYYHQECLNTNTNWHYQPSWC